MEQPFSENEVVSDPTNGSHSCYCSVTISRGLGELSETNVRQRYFLAEILKKSSIAPDDLMSFIQERGLQPSWYEIALPNGAQGMRCEESPRAEIITHRSLCLLMHSSLATPPSKRPGSVLGACAAYGHF